MGSGFARIPEAGRYRLANATLPACLAEVTDLPRHGDGLVSTDITIEDGRIAALAPPVTEATG